MTQHDESKHPRDRQGRFANKPSGSVGIAAGVPQIDDGSTPVYREGPHDDYVDAHWIDEGYDGSGGPQVTSAVVYFDPDEDEAVVSGTVYDNLTWDDRFSQERLDRFSAVVEETYSERYGAELYVPDEDWSQTQVTLHSKPLSQRGLTEASTTDAFHAAYAKYVNETDPGTYNSPYIGDELDRRLRLLEASEAEARERGVPKYMVTDSFHRPRLGFDSLEEAQEYTNSSGIPRHDRIIFGGDDYRVQYSWREKKWRDLIGAPYPNQDH